MREEKTEKRERERRRKKERDKYRVTNLRKKEREQEREIEKESYERSNNVLFPSSIADQVHVHGDGAGEGLLVVHVGITLDKFVLEKKYFKNRKNKVFTQNKPLSIFVSLSLSLSLLMF